MTISAATGQGLKELSETLFKLVQEQKEAQASK
jgi:predicted GTPase